MTGGGGGGGGSSVRTKRIRTIPDLGIMHPQGDPQLWVGTQRQKGGNGEFAVVCEFDDGE